MYMYIARIHAYNSIHVPWPIHTVLLSFSLWLKHTLFMCSKRCCFCLLSTLGVDVCDWSIESTLCILTILYHCPIYYSTTGDMVKYLIYTDNIQQQAYLIFLRRPWNASGGILRWTNNFIAVPVARLRTIKGKYKYHRFGSVPSWIA